jgi:hypothetical protein
VLLLAGLSAIGQGGAGVLPWALLLAAAATLFASPASSPARRFRCSAVTATTLGTSGSGDGTATQLGTALSIALLVPLAAGPDDAIAGLRLAFVGTAAIAAVGGAAVLVVLRSAGQRPTR